MSEPAPRGPRPLLAAVGVLLWLAAAAAAVRLGFWRALGTTAVIVGLGSVMVDPSLAWSLVRRPWRMTARFVLLGLLSGAGMAALAWALYPAVVGPVPWLAADTSVLYLSFAALPLAQAGLVLPAVVLGEELFWRGLLHEAFLSRLPAAAAAGLGAGAYALGNAPTGSPVLVMAAFGCGLVWSGLRVATGGLVAPLISHLTWNALVLFVHPLSR